MQVLPTLLNRASNNVVMQNLNQIQLTHVILEDGCKNQFRVHIIQPKEVVMLADTKQRKGKSLLSYLPVKSISCRCLQPNGRSLT